MPAISTDLLKKLSRKWVGQIGAAGVTDGTVVTVPLSSTTNLVTDTAVVATIDRVDANGTKTPTLEETVIGVVSGSNLATCTRGAEGTAQSHTAGAVVEILVTAKGYNDIIDHLLVGHTQLGAHTSALVTSLKATGATINTGTDDATIVTPKAIADSKLADFIRGDGWISAVDTWTYASASTITVPSGAASKYAKGDKIKLTQTTVKYFYVVGVADTVLTVVGDGAVVVTNAAISANYYSHQTSPIGFNTWFTWSPTITWTGGAAPSGSPTKNEKFRVDGSGCTINLFNYGYTAGTTVTVASIPLPFAITSQYQAGYGMVSAAEADNPTATSLTNTTAELVCTSNSAARIRLMTTYWF